MYDSDVYARFVSNGRTIINIIILNLGYFARARTFHNKYYTKIKLYLIIATKRESNSKIPRLFFSSYFTDRPPRASRPRSSSAFHILTISLAWPSKHHGNYITPRSEAGTGLVDLRANTRIPYKPRSATVDEGEDIERSSRRR